MITVIQEQSVKYWIGVFRSCGFVPFEGKWLRKGELYIGNKDAENYESECKSLL